MAGRLVGWLACHGVPTVPGASSSKPVANPVASPVAYPVAKSGQGLAGLIRRLIRGSRSIWRGKRGRPLRALKLRGRLPRQRQGTQRPLRGNPTPITTSGPRRFSRQEDNSLGEEMKDGVQNGGSIRGA